MKTTTLFLSALGTASLVVASITIAGEQQAKAPAEEIPRETLVKFHQAVNAQVLEHLNPKISLADRFSRRIAPRSGIYYHAEIAGSPKGKIIEFKVVRNDHTNPKELKREVFANGRFNSNTGEVALFDEAKGTFVPAPEHPSIRKGGTT